jgi:hypothetical protein
MAWVHNASPEVLAKSQYPAILGVVLGLTGLMVITVALRGYVRAVMVKAVGKDDWVILFSAVRCPGSGRWRGNADSNCRFAVLFTVDFALAVSFPDSFFVG